jgi:hypothetical protein
MLAEGNDLDAGHGLACHQPRQDLVGWRTTRTALRGEQLGDDRDARLRARGTQWTQIYSAERE